MTRTTIRTTAPIARRCIALAATALLALACGGSSDDPGDGADPDPDPDPVEKAVCDTVGPGDICIDFEEAIDLVPFDLTPVNSDKQWFRRLSAIERGGDNSAVAGQSLGDFDTSAMELTLVFDAPGELSFDFVMRICAAGTFFVSLDGDERLRDSTPSSGELTRSLTMPVATAGAHTFRFSYFQSGPCGGGFLGPAIDHVIATNARFP